MQRLELICGATILFFLSAGIAAAREQHEHGLPASGGIELLSGNGRTTIPFELVNNHIIIPISINGREFGVILDTGMPMSGLMLYGTEEVEALGLKYGPVKARIGGAGGEHKTLEASIASGVTIDIEDARMTDATVIVAPPIPHFTLYHQGVIGASLFNNFVVDINYDESRITLHNPKVYDAPDDAVALPLTFTHNIPYTEVNVTLDDGRTIPLTVVVDLGASHPISLNADSSDAIAIPDRAIRTIIGRGVAGEVRGQVGRIRHLELGGNVLDDVVATFPVRGHQNPGGMDSRNGNLGDGVLKRFNVTFDYSRERMLLAPNRQFDEPFEWDMSGMRLEPDDEAALRIGAIIEDSPAARAGLKIDDLVTHVNGRAVSGDDMLEVREMMKRDGSILEIGAARAGKPIEVKLKLRRIV